METQQSNRDITAVGEDSRLKKGDLKPAAKFHEAEIPEVVNIPADEVADTDAAPASIEDATTQEAAAAAVSQKPMQHKREHRLDADARAQNSEMLRFNALEKESQQHETLLHNKQAASEPRVPEQDLPEPLPLPHLQEQQKAQRGEKGDNERNVPLEKGEKLLKGKPHKDAVPKKKQHKQLSQQQLRKLGQELEETEKPAVSQQREERSTSPTSSSSSTASDEKGEFGEEGAVLRQEPIGAVAQKQMQHDSPLHKKERLRESEGEVEHVPKAQQHDTLLKEQQASKGREGGSKDIQHHKQAERPLPREEETSNNAGEEEVHGKRHELVNKTLPRDQVRDQEKLQTNQAFGKLQESQQRSLELPTKNKQSEDDKRMSTKIGQQLPEKQEAGRQEQKKPDAALPSQKN